MPFTLTLGTALPLFSVGDCIKFSVTNPYITTSTDPNLIAIQNYYVPFPSTPAVSCASLTTGVSMSCTSTNYVLTMKVGLTSAGSTIKSIIGTINSFQNPFSSVSTVISIGYYSQCLSTATNQYTSTLSFTSGVFVIAPTPSATLTSSSTVIGAQGVVLTVSFTPATLLQVSGEINLVVPPYYTLSTGASSEAIITYNPNNLPLVTSTQMTISNVQFRPADKTLTFSYTLSAMVTSTATTPLSFSVTQFNNPINSSPLSGFVLSTADPNGNSIDVTQGSFSLSGITTAAQIQTASVQLLRVSDSQPDLTIAQTGRMIEVSFSINFPVIDNCYVKITFPEEIKIDADESLNTYSGQGFISTSILSSQVIKKPYSSPYTGCNCNYVVVPGCTDPSFLGDSASGVILLQNVVSPCQVKTTGNFQIDFYQDQALTSQIATTSSNSALVLRFTGMTAGTVTATSFAPVTTTTIGASTDYKVAFSVQHNLYADSVIDIQIPSLTSSISTTICIILSQSTQFDTGITCSILQTTPTTIFRILNPFSTSNTNLWAMVVNPLVPSTGQFTLQINGIINPPSVEAAGSWSVFTKNLVEGVYYMVDSGSTSTSYTPVEGTLTASGSGGLIVSDKTTYITTATYTFLLSIQNSIAVGGTVEIDVPSDFSMPSTVSCSQQNPLVTSTQYISQVCSKSGSIIMVTLNQAQPSTATLNMQIAGLRNPRTFQPTGSFSFTTRDSGSHIIDQGSGFSTLMSVMNTFPTFGVTFSNKTNGAQTVYTITFTSSAVPILNGDVLYITWPSNVVLPSSAVCTKIQGFITITCSNSGQNMIIKMTTVSQSTGQYSFSVANVLNPSSTRLSSPFSGIYTTDVNGYDVSQLLTSVQPTVITTTAANILAYQLYQDNLQLGVDATYRIQFTPTNPISSTGSIVIGWPTQVSINSSMTCFVTTNQKYSNLCTLSFTANTITIIGAFASLTSSYISSILIDLYPVTNPVDNSVVNGFTIATYDDANQVYKIDILGPNILIPQTACNYPCQTCLGSDPNYCLSCWTDNQFMHLQSSASAQTCQSQCNSGFTTNGDPNLVCVTCDPSCSTCADKGIVGDNFKCLTCASQTPYFYPLTSKCMSSCQAGFYQSAKLQCSPCTSPCQQCNGTGSTCTNCYQNGTYPLLYNKTCISNCPTFFVGVSNVCVHCQTPCSNCINTTSQCLGCDQTQIQKYLYAYQCYQTCPIGTVPNNQTMTCKGCLTGCTSCDTLTQTICYACQSPLILFNSTCLNDCPSGYKSSADGLSCDVVTTQQFNDLTLIYFPHLICCALMTILSIGGYFKDRKSIIITNMIILWAPLEFLSFIVQVILGVFYSPILTTGASAIALVCYIILNVTFCIVFEKTVAQVDEQYKFWYNLHPKTSKFIMVMSGIVSFKIVRLKYSYLYGFDNFKSRFSDPQRFRKILMWFTFVHMIFSNGIMIAIDALDLLQFQMKNQMNITQIETGAISVIMILMVIIEMCRNHRFISHDYKSVEGEALHSQMMDQADKQIRRDMLKKIMQQFKGTQDLHNNTNIKHLDELVERFRPRRCNSMLPINNDREDDPRLVKSEPPSPKPDWEGREPSNLIEKNVDNVYADSKPSDPLGKIGKTYSDFESMVTPEEFGRVITRQGVNFFNPDGLERSRKKNKNKSKKRGRKNQYYTQIDAEDDEEADNLQEMSQHDIIDDDNKLGVIREEIPENLRKSIKSETQRRLDNEMKQIEEEKQKLETAESVSKLQDDQEARRLEEEIALNNATLGKKQNIQPMEGDKIVEVPPNAQLRNFNENDILGNFDRDEKGNIIILQDQEGNYTDKQGRRVNERGYLINPETGDIIEHNQQQTMFEKEEIDERGEIPAPFCVEKHNFNPFKLRGDVMSPNNKQVLNKNKSGAYIDKRGRLINKKGWLIDRNGNIVDYMGMKKFDAMQLIPETGDMPRLFNYQGQRYDIMDVCGTFELDPITGKIIVKKNQKGQSFDSLGRLVNEQGYLIDFNGNIVDNNGKRIFEKNHLSSNGEIPKIFPFTKFNVKNIQGDFEMDPHGIPILEVNDQGFFMDVQGKRVNQRGYYCDEAGNIIDKKGKIMFDKVILDQEGEIPEVFRSGLLKSDTASSLSRLMSEIERNQPEELYQNEKLQQKQKKVVAVKFSGGNTSVESQMDDTPSNYNELNQRFGPRALVNKNKKVKIEESKRSLDGIGSKKKSSKRRKKVVQEYNEPSGKDVKLAKAYGGVARGSQKRIIPKGIIARGINSPDSSISHSRRLHKISGSVAGYQQNQISLRDLEESKRDQMSNTGFLNQNQSAFVLNATNDPSVQAVPEHHIREQRLKQQKLKELKLKGKMNKNRAAGPGDPNFEKMFGKDIDEFLEDSDWDIESFENMSNYSRGTARSAFLDGRMRGLESIYLQRIESSMNRGGQKTKISSRKPKFRVLQDRFTDDPAQIHEREIHANELLSNHSIPRGVNNPGTMSNSSLGMQQIGQAHPLSAMRNKAGTSHKQYRQGTNLLRRKLQ